MKAKIFAAAATAALAMGAASAQSASSDAGAQPEGAPKTDLQNKKGDLSQKLDKTNGVIHPQGAVDPGMDKKAPSVGDTPVIRPPGAPGGPRTEGQPK